MAQNFFAAPGLIHFTGQSLALDSTPLQELLLFFNNAADLFLQLGANNLMLPGMLTFPDLLQSMLQPGKGAGPLVFPENQVFEVPLGNTDFLLTLQTGKGVDRLLDVSKKLPTKISNRPLHSQLPQMETDTAGVPVFELGLWT